jgi:capsid portal protein
LLSVKVEEMEVATRESSRPGVKSEVEVKKRSRERVNSPERRCIAVKVNGKAMELLLLSDGRMQVPGVRLGRV